MAESNDNSDKLLSVDELEEKIKGAPNDLSLKEDLAQALVDRYLDGDEEHDPGNKADIKRVREVLTHLPKEKASYARAYIAYLDENDDAAVRFLSSWAKGSDEAKIAEPLTADELYAYIIAPFEGASPQFWSNLAKALSELWLDASASLTLEGYVREVGEKPEDAIDFYEHALSESGDYWLAVWGLGEVHYLQKNWQAASQYYAKALESESARAIASIYFDLAVCSDNLRRHPEEENHYRKCLEIEPDYPYARNNLGWSLYSQGRFEEALKIFDECIERKVDGCSISLRDPPDFNEGDHEIGGAKRRSDFAFYTKPPWFFNPALFSVSFSL